MNQILVVEDSPNIQRWLAALLKREFPQAQITTAATRKAASAELARNRPDLLILDLGLPEDELDTAPRAEAGLSLLEQLKDRPDKPPLVIIVLSSYEELEAECATQGAKGFVSKNARDLGKQLLALLRSEPSDQ